MQSFQHDAGRGEGWKTEFGSGKISTTLRAEDREFLSLFGESCEGRPCLPGTGLRATALPAKSTYECVPSPAYMPVPYTLFQLHLNKTYTWLSVAISQKETEAWRGWQICPVLQDIHIVAQRALNSVPENAMRHPWILGFCVLSHTSAYFYRFKDAKEKCFSLKCVSSIFLPQIQPRRNQRRR